MKKAYALWVCSRTWCAGSPPGFPGASKSNATDTYPLTCPQGSHEN